MKPYDHKEIEAKWRKEWQEKGTNKTTEDPQKPKCYVLDMFPYPSGEGLHVGHPKGYIATDIYSRFKKMSGFNVLHPMGWDAFGLPAENYAIKNKVHPRVAVEKNIARFKEQLNLIGFNYDWEREIDTTDPKYYTWTQWIFLKLLEKGLAYESFEPINWCPSCQTGLANEDLDGDKCERCGTLVEKKPMRQWVLKITDYAERLLSDIDALDWPESIKESQRNWIGKSEGAELEFQIKNQDTKIKVFTTRADTLFGVTYLVLAPEHALLEKLKASISNYAEIQAYASQVKNIPDIERTAVKEKTGVELKGIKAVNPVNGEEIPVWVADYVLASYGTGAVMAVPAHDERDFAFATKFNLPIKEVVVPNIIDVRNPPHEGKKIVERKNVHAIVKNPKNGKYLAIKWKQFPWTTFPMGGVEEGEEVIAAAKREVREETGFSNLKFIKVLDGQVRAEYFAAHKDQNRISLTTAVLFELNDETQIPVSKEESDAHEVIWLDESQLNYDTMTHAEVGQWQEKMASGYTTFCGHGVLINSSKYNGLDSRIAIAKITEDSAGKLKTTYKLRDWVFSRQRYWGEPIPVVHCEKDGVVAVPEKDLPVVLPEVESYAPSGTGESPLATIEEWVNTVCPKCGGKAKRETNTMPQWAGSSWYYLRYIDPSNQDALVDKNKEKYWSPVDLYVGGAEHATRHLIYARFWHKFLFDIGVVNYTEPFKRLQHVGLINAEDGRKMSKRYGNVVNPDDIVSRYGADTLRVYEMFMGPFDQQVSWSMKSIIGPRRLLEKLWKLSEKVLQPQSQKGAEAILHKTIKKVSSDIEDFKFNTAISALMILANELEKTATISKEEYEAVLKLFAPFAPHITDELWQMLGNTGSIHVASWPVCDESKLKETNVKIVIQINGKLRANIEASADEPDDAITQKALQHKDISKRLEGKKVLKTIVVRNKLINFVVPE